MLALHHLRLLFVGLSALLTAGLVWSLAIDRGPAPRREVRAAVVAPPPPPAALVIPALQAERARITTTLAEVPEYREFRDKFATAFPGDWARALDVLSDRPAALVPGEAADAYFVESLKTLRRSRGALAAKAAPENLTKIFALQTNLLSALAATDKRLCVDFLFGEESRGFLSFASKNRALVAAIATAALDAVIDGAGRRIERGAPTDADFQKLEAALTARGLGAAEIEALLDGRHPDPPIADDRLCDAGLVYLDVLRQLPDETRFRIYALAVELMARS